MAYNNSISTNQHIRIWQYILLIVERKRSRLNTVSGLNNTRLSITWNSSINGLYGSKCVKYLVGSSKSHWNTGVTETTQFANNKNRTFQLLLFRLQPICNRFLYNETAHLSPMQNEIIKKKTTYCSFFGMHFYHTCIVFFFFYLWFSSKL